MKKESLCLLVFAIVASAQRPEHEALVARLNADLMPMKSIESSLGDPAQTRAMVRFATDVNALDPVGFCTRRLAYALTNALAGKD